MRMVGYALFYALLLACVVAFNAGAHTHGSSPDGGAGRIVARVHCTHAAEDSLAHLTLTHARYVDDGRGTWYVTYRCDRAGYIDAHARIV